jgi:flagellar biosynthesis/type III secretory pathway protein FliH
VSVNIIKATPGTGLPQSARIPKALTDASEQAKETVARARDEAEEIVRTAHLEREALIAESKQQGYAAGLDKWNDALAEAWDARSRYLATNETVVVQLAMAVARKIVGEAVSIDPTAVLQSAREAIRSARGEQKLRLRVRPEDESIMRQQTIELKRANSEIGEIQVIADESITLGGCIVESSLGTIDAQFSTQLQSLERALLRGADAGNHRD